MTRRHMPATVTKRGLLTELQLSETGLEALENLLTALADDTTETLRWSYRCNLGIAGYVQFSIDVHPYGLTQAERDTILTTAARLVNWNQP